ncbi:MAG: hypothetical protein JW793_06615 [Acidobacteria bacterium]|nr:hypothetical protein [Acidobacteriota bacterium]
MKKLLAMAGILCCLVFAFGACSSDTGTENEIDEAMDAAEEEAGSLMDQAEETAGEAMDAAEDMADEAREIVE